jgi:hypothetical protein
MWMAVLFMRLHDWKKKVDVFLLLIKKQFICYGGK